MSGCRQIFFTVLATFFIIAVAGTGTAYGGDGNLTIAGAPTPATGICADDNDNDGDGLTDGNDTGCTKPYAYDRSEYDMRDSDLSYNLYGNLPPGEDNLTVSTPGKVKENLDNSVYDSSVGSYTIDEIWLDQLGYAQWAGGELKRTELSFSGSVSGSPSLGRGAAIINTPLGIEFASINNVETCGNGDRNTGEGKNIDCPQDFGFPDDLRNATGTRTADQSITDISSELGEFEVDVGTDPGYLMDRMQSDKPNYTMDMYGSEARAGPNENTNTDWRVDIRENGTSDDPDPYSVRLLFEAPDFYANGRQMKAVYLEASTEPFGNPVDDYDLVGEDITDYDNASYQIPRSCSFSQDAEGWECDFSGSYCISESDNSARNYSLDFDFAWRNITTQIYGVQQTPDNNNKEWEDPGYRESTINQNLKIRVARHLEGDYNLVEADNCGNHNAQEADCDVKEGVTNENGSCTESSYQWVYEDSDPDYNGPDSNGDAYTSTVKDSIQLRYEDLTYETKPVFSTIYEQNGNLPSDATSVEALFGSDYTNSEMDNILHRQQYYSWERDSSNRHFSNSPAVSVSSFKIVAQDDKFHSLRDFYGVWDIDGTNGLSDSFVALKEQEVKNDPAPFANETRIIMGSGKNPGVPKKAEQQVFIGVLGYRSSPGNPPGCPGDHIFCVSAVDVDAKDWEDWSSPTQPTAKFESIDTIDVNQSWGACRKYQELIGGADKSILRCQYDWGDDFPGNPTPFWKPSVITHINTPPGAVPSNGGTN